MRRTLLIVGVASSLCALAPATASADAGCKENGQAVAGAAQALQPFGQFVSTQTPINDDVATFKAIFCT
jgi:hypothetical protein